MEHWSHNYITQARWVAGGRDFPVIDCWGLVVDVFETQLGITLPRFEGHKHEDDGLWDMMQAEASDRSRWVPVETNQRRAFDVVLIRQIGYRYPTHVGVMIDEDHFLQIGKMGATVELCAAWNRRIKATYRHADLA